MALESVRLVREGARQAGRDDVVVAFACRTQDWPADQQHKAKGYDGYYVQLDLENYLKPLAELLANADAESKPDVILMEIQSWIPEDLEFPDYQVFLDTGIPVWIAYRRTIGKLVGVEGELIIDDGDRFGHAAKKFEEMGAAAVLVNCLPPKQVGGVGAWLRQFTNITLGAYPNMGKYLHYEWDWYNCETPEEIAELAQGWADEGVQIIGGCCGARPAHIKKLVEQFKVGAPVVDATGKSIGGQNDMSETISTARTKAVSLDPWHLDSWQARRTQDESEGSRRPREDQPLVPLRHRARSRARNRACMCFRRSPGHSVKIRPS